MNHPSEDRERWFTKLRAEWFRVMRPVYLALGRPVVLQETGWTRAVAPSDGMLI